jgi:sulfonate transport system permease protein
MTLIQTPSAPLPALPRIARALSGALGPLREAAAPVLLGLSFPVALVALWSLGAARGWVVPQILPAPAVVWQSFLGLWADGSLALHTRASLIRVAEGFALGAAAGLALGAAVALVPAVRAWVWPPLQAATRVNVLAWMPLLTLFLGIDEALKVVVIGWSVSIPVILSTARAIGEVPASLRELGAVLNLDRRQRLRLIVLPQALPQIATGLREGLANAWQSLVIVELFASFEGLGYLMTWGRQLFQLDLVLVAMAVIAVLGFTLDAALRGLERRLQPWQTEAGHGR